MNIEKREIKRNGVYQSTNDFGLASFKTIDIIKKEWKNKVKVWMPGDGKTHETGKPFVFRFLPHLLGSDDASSEYFGNGRNEEGEFDVEMCRIVGYIRQFGSGDTKVDFIPCQTYEPNGGYAKYGGVKDNPYKILINGLRQAKRSDSLRKEWKPLAYTSDEVKEFLQKNNVKAKFPRLLLPGFGQRYVTYALVYDGYDAEHRQIVHQIKKPIGSEMKNLNIILLTEQMVEILEYDYRQTVDRSSNKYLHKDPAFPAEGCLNYVWNEAFASPIDGRKRPGKFGYVAAVDESYFIDQEETKIDNSLSEPFQEWYYKSWQPFDEVLEPKIGKEQINLIAEYFPQLGCVCRDVFDGDKQLIEWVEDARFVFDENIDFAELLISINNFKEGVSRSSTTNEEKEVEPRSRSREVEEEEEERPKRRIETEERPKSRVRDDEEEDVRPKSRVRDDEEEEEERPKPRREFKSILNKVTEKLNKSDEESGETEDDDDAPF